MPYFLARLQIHRQTRQTFVPTIEIVIFSLVGLLVVLQLTQINSIFTFTVHRDKCAVKDDLTENICVHFSSGHLIVRFSAICSFKCFITLLPFDTRINNSWSDSTIGLHDSQLFAYFVLHTLWSCDTCDRNAAHLRICLLQLSTPQGKLKFAKLLCSW